MSSLTVHEKEWRKMSPKGKKAMIEVFKIISGQGTCQHGILISKRCHQCDEWLASLSGGFYRRNPRKG